MTAHLLQLHKSSQKITFYWIILQALSMSCNDFPKKGKPNSQIHILSQFSEGKPLRALPGFLLVTTNISPTHWPISNPTGDLSASATDVQFLQISCKWPLGDLSSYGTDIHLGDFDAQTLKSRHPHGSGCDPPHTPTRAGWAPSAPLPPPDPTTTILKQFISQQKQLATQS